MGRPRISIQRLMTVVAFAAGLSWLYQSVYPHAFLPAFGYAAVVAAFSIGPWHTARSDRRLAARVMAVSAALEFVALTYLGVFSLRYLSAVYKLLISLILMPFTLGAGVAWANLASAPSVPKRVPRPAAWSLVVGLTLLPVSMIASHWPMRAAFRISRPALDRLADRVAAGETLARPEWAGLFLVRKVSRVDVGPGNIPLVVENDSTGHTFLIRASSPAAVPAVSPDAPVNHRETTLSYRISDGGRWWHHETD